MFFFFLALFAPPLIAMGLVFAKLFGFNVKWWQVFVVPIVVFVIGLIVSVIPFLLLALMLVVAR